MKMRALAVGLLGLVPMAAFAQAPVRMPQASPAASISETIGVTDVTINYHRPAVNKRRIFGGLVPYGVVWRAGANESTTISFSTPVKVEGQPVAAGTYGLFLIPAADKWTMVLSRFAGSWGTYNYDPSEDALRVPVTAAVTNNSHERLMYMFDDATDNSATASLRWEKVRVPFRIEVDLPATVRASIRSELRGGKHWDSDSWAAAARFESRNGDLETALRYADHAVENGASFNALMTKASILDKKGDKAAAAALRERARAVANESEGVSFSTGSLMGAKKYDDVIAWANAYAAAHPDSPNLFRVYTVLGDAYNGKGDGANARASYDRAMAAAHDMAERTEVQDSINAAGAEQK